MTTVDSWPKTLPMMSVGSWNSTTETHLLGRPTFSELTGCFQKIEDDYKIGKLHNSFCYTEMKDFESGEEI